jgi:5-methylcytosine-specific restriction endonuclease McrA
MLETNGKLSCQKCRKPYKKGFHVHHTDYTRFQNEDFGDMVLLCEPCHRKTHGMKPLKRYHKIPPVLKIKGIDY